MIHAVLPQSWRRSLAALLVAGASVAGSAQAGPSLDLTQGWRFLPGDDLGRKEPGFDDGAWERLSVGLPWEKQGHKDLYGLAWYRLRFTLPERLRAEDPLKEGVLIRLGRIGDCDQTFLNGRLVGTEGEPVPPGTEPDPGFAGLQDTFKTLERVYFIPAGDPRLRWGAENVLAVRVRQTDDEGGLLSPGPCLTLAGAPDLVTLDAGRHDFTFRGAAPSKAFQVASRAAATRLAAQVRVRAVGAVSARVLLERTCDLDLPPGRSEACAFELPALEEAARVAYDLRVGGGAWTRVLDETSPYLLTPEAPAAPRINGPAVLGARPGHPVVFTVPATGARPMAFSAKGLPEGLALDPATGILRGSVARAGTWHLEVAAQNAKGSARRGLDLVVGPDLALTPPMGWNSWNCWGLSVDEEKVAASARTFVEKGLRDHGWSYVNIDDGWEIPGSGGPGRTRDGRIVVNGKFPDMARLGRRLHELGLRFGIYSSPGPLTCGGYTGSFGHEAEDAASYAEWGVDYLKYDWCSYGKIARDRSLPELMKPYLSMRRELDRAPRDIVFSLCQYGMGDVWTWGARAGGQLWRTTGDIEDTWDSLKDIGFRQVANAPYAGPGHWNDPDMLVVGRVGWGPSLHPTRLAPDEQYTHISLWCMLSAPLLIGCDLASLDPFTLNLLTNDEVLALDQDPLGRQATPTWKRGDLQVWVKELAGGGRALACFNLGPAPAACPLDFKALGLPQPRSLRDLWRQRDLGLPREVTVPSHGVVLLRAF